MPGRFRLMLLAYALLLIGCQPASRMPAVFIDAKQYQGEGLYVFFVPDTQYPPAEPPSEGMRLLYMNLINGTGQTLLIEDVAGWDKPSIGVSAKPADGSSGRGYFSPCIRSGQLKFQEHRPQPRGEVERMIRMRWLMDKHEVEHRTYQYGSKTIPIAIPDWPVPTIVTVDDALRTYATDPTAHRFIPINVDIRVEPK